MRTNAGGREASDDDSARTIGGTRYAGGCACGAVRFELQGEPTVVGLCHCTKCRKETGSAFLAYADWSRESFTVRGDVREYDGRSFCPVCGSRLFHLSDARAEVMLGALDAAPTGLRPTREGWTVRREHWQQPVPGSEQFLQDTD